MIYQDKLNKALKLREILLTEDTRILLIIVAVVMAFTCGLLVGIAGR